MNALIFISESKITSLYEYIDAACNQIRFHNDFTSVTMTVIIIRSRFKLIFISVVHLQT